VIRFKPLKWTRNYLSYYADIFLGWYFIITEYDNFFICALKFDYRHPMTTIQVGKSKTLKDAKIMCRNFLRKEFKKLVIE
jgi:hypothetical protein